MTPREQLEKKMRLEYERAASSRFRLRKDVRTVTDAEVAACLDRARKRMNKSGEHWLKGQFFAVQEFLRGRGRRPKQEACYCAAGAIIAETKGDPSLRYATMRQLTLYLYGNTAKYAEPNALEQIAQGHKLSLGGLNARIGGFIAVIYRWNDASSRTWKEVDEAFRRATGAARREARKADRQKAAA